MGSLGGELQFKQIDLPTVQVVVVSSRNKIECQKIVNSDLLGKLNETYKEPKKLQIPTESPQTKRFKILKNVHSN